jgi:UDP-N-acetylmuramyl pentapeptide phosphotransferase/UDP-N-acetylglucosamine-1-phosphate transferase
MLRRSTLIVGLILLLLAAILLATRKPHGHAPLLTIQVPGDLRITYLQQGWERREDCEQALANLAGVALTACPTCGVWQKQCLDKPGPVHLRWLSTAPLDVPSIRLPEGVALYRSSDPRLAQSACEESERRALTQAKRVECHAPGSFRPLRFRHGTIDARLLGLSAVGMLLAAVVSWFVGLLLVRYAHMHAHLSNDHPDSGPQKFHATPTPRIGGIALFCGLLAAGGWLLLPLDGLGLTEPWYLLLTAIPVFFGGLGEDITRRVGALERLLLAFVSAALCAWLLGATLLNLDTPGLHPLVRWAPLAVIVTLFCVGGVAHAFNIIDGYNGLSSGYAVIALLAIAFVAAQVGDELILHAALACVGALLGFMMWNWPAGKIFMGDGGAYLIGFMIAELSVLLMARNPSVSPWFPLALTAYPVFETIFSIHRRLILRGRPAYLPDAMHLHQLVYSRVVRIDAGKHDPEARLRRNNRVAPYFWVINAFAILWAALFWSHKPMLIAGVLTFCALYLVLYRRIVLWRTPRWLIAR